MRLQELMIEIEEWAGSTFKDQPLTGKAQHLVKEAEELKAELENDINSDETKEEIADCFILLVNIATKAGLTANNLLYEVELKMAKNKARKWGKLNEQGYSEHIKE